MSFAVSPNSRRQRRTSSPTLGEPLFASTSTSSLRPNPSSPTSSKSVLTIALQRAQSAVLLDSANNVPAAIAAYTQSVRLLKEVMARVEEGGRKEEEVKEGETAEGTARREARKVRKDRAKKDEQRRLKVIVSRQLVREGGGTLIHAHSTIRTRTASACSVSWVLPKRSEEHTSELQSQ